MGILTLKRTVAHIKMHEHEKDKIDAKTLEGRVTLKVKAKAKGKILKNIKPKFAKFRNDLKDEDTDGDYDPIKDREDEEKEK
jgi:hypothetical protein